MWFSGGAVASVGSGAAWTQYNDLPTSRAWKTIQYAPFAIDYIILGDNNSADTDDVCISTDAVTWTGNTIDNSQEWGFSVYGGGKLYAAQKSGDPSYSIYWTENMLEWEGDGIVNFSVGNAVEIQDLLWNGTKLVIIGKQADEGIVLAGVAGDPAPWANVRWPDADDIQMRGIDYDGVGTYLMVGGPVIGPIRTATNIIYRQQGTVTDTWEELTLPTSLVWTDVVYGNGRWLAFARGSSTIAISTNSGDTWTTATLPASYPSEDRAKAGFGLDRFVYYSTNRVYTSSDGALWSRSDASFSFTYITDWDFSAGIGLATGVRSIGNHTSYLKYAVN